MSDSARSETTPDVPDFECEDCIGMKEHGCYCRAMGARGPGGPMLDTRRVRWCRDRGIDPFELCADGGVEAWMTVTDHDLQRS